MNKNAENRMIRKFLLGLADEREAEAVGLRIIEDEEFDATMSAAEESLLEDYLDGRLDAVELEAFKSTFIVSNRREDALREIVALRELASRESTAAGVDSGRASFGLRLASFFGGPRLAFGVGLVALVAVAAAVGFVLLRGDGLTPIEREYAAINSKAAASVPEINGLTTKSLFAEVFRGEARSSALKLADSTDKILFRLALPAGGGPDKRDVEIVAGAAVVFRQPQVPVVRSAAGDELDIVVPRSVLRPGELSIRVGNGATFSFRVE